MVSVCPVALGTGSALYWAVASALFLAAATGCPRTLPGWLGLLSRASAVYPPICSPAALSPQGILSWILFLGASLMWQRAGSSRLLFTQLLEPQGSPEGWRSHSPWLLELQAPWTLAPGTCNLTNKLSQSQGSNWSPVGWRGGRSSRSTPLCSHVAAAMEEEDALAEGAPQAPEAVC